MKFISSKILLILMLFTISFLLTASVIRRFVPWPVTSCVRAKHDYFEQHKDEYDILVFGSSRVLRGFNSLIFNKAARELGQNWRSFNFGIPGMKNVETAYVVDQVLSLRPKRLKCVVVEWHTPDPCSLWKSETITDRMAFWHAPAPTYQVLKNLLMIGCDPKVGIKALRNHLLSFFCHITNYGCGKLIVQEILGLESRTQKELDTESIILQNEGFDPYLQDNKKKLPWYTTLEAYKKQLRKITFGNKIDVKLERYDLTAPGSLKDKVEAAGFKIVFIVMPGDTPTPLAYQLNKMDLLTPFIGYNDPSNFREIYRPTNRYSSRYMNEAGSQLFSRQLAQDLTNTLSDL